MAGSRSAREALTRDQWDALLDGNPHEVDLFDLRFHGGISSFRAAVYREAEKRYGYAKTKRISVSIVQVQGIDCRPDFARRHQASPVPWRAIDPPTAIPTPPEDDDEPLTPEEADQLLGPCTCGQAPKCLPNCSRFN